MVLHGGGGAGLDVAQPGEHPLSVFRNVADTARILVVYPEGSPDSQGNPGWNDCRNDDQSGAQGDDLVFLQQLMGRLTQEMGLTAQNMYLTGTSNGALMTFSYAFNFPSTIKAIAVSSGNLPLNPPKKFPYLSSIFDVPVLCAGGSSCCRKYSETWHCMSCIIQHIVDQRISALIDPFHHIARIIVIHIECGTGRGYIRQIVAL